MKILFMGRKPVAARALRWLCDQVEVSVVGVVTDSHLSVSPTRDLAMGLSIPVFSRNEVEEKIRGGELEMDLGVSVLYWQKIREPILTKAQLGVINFHPAPLPEYKGTAGYNVAILESLSQWAVSAHYVDEQIDTGEIIDVCRFDIDAKNETAMTLEAKAQPILFDQIKKVLRKVIDAQAKLPSTPNIGGRYISRDEMEAMKEVKEGDDVDRKIRAFWFPPYDGAYKIVNGVKCTLVNRQILNGLANPCTSNLFTAPPES